MNVMCDLTQFVISIIVYGAHSEPLGKLFMEKVVFFGGWLKLFLSTQIVSFGSI